MICDYDGTVLIVSHDRDFLDRTVTLTLGLDGSGKVDIIAGGYADWERLRETPNAQAKKSAAKPAVQSVAPKKRMKLSFKDQRDFELLPAEIEVIDAEIERDEASLADATLYARDPGKFAALTRAVEEARLRKETAEERWLNLAEQVEALEKALQKHARTQQRHPLLQPHP